MLLGWKMLLRWGFRCCLQKGGWGGWGGVITSCQVCWMMLNPGKCCLVGRCCYVASFVVVYRRRGGGGWGGVITSCQVRWMMLNPGRCCLVGRCCYVASFVVVYRRRGTEGGGGGWGGCNNVMSSALDDVESWKMLPGWNMLLRCSLQKGGGGVGGGVITSCDCTVRKSMVLSLLPTASNSVCGHEDEKGAFFISSMVLQCIITCSTSEQNDQNKRNRTSNG